jgi:hypothetical protein
VVVVMAEGPIARFRASLREEAPPEGAAPALAALWRAGRGEWIEAHALVQGEPDADSAWVHAHLHRQEGDLGNAAYWYRRAGRPEARGSIEDEWAEIVGALAPTDTH